MPPQRGPLSAFFAGDIQRNHRISTDRFDPGAGLGSVARNGRCGVRAAPTGAAILASFVAAAATGGIDHTGQCAWICGLGSIWRGLRARQGVRDELILKS